MRSHDEFADIARHYADYYTGHSKKYNALRFDSDNEVEATIETLTSHRQWPHNGIVAEVGCGTARHLLALRSVASGRYLGVDLSLSQLQAIEDRDLAVVVGDARRLPLQNGSLDGYLSIMMIHQIMRKDLTRFALEARRVVKEGGFVFIKTCSQTDLAARPLVRYFPSTLQANLARYHSIDVISESLRRAGFHATSVEACVTSDIYPREEFLARVRGRGNTALSFVPKHEFDEGFEMLVEDLANTAEYTMVHRHTYVHACSA